MTQIELDIIFDTLCLELPKYNYRKTGRGNYWVEFKNILSFNYVLFINTYDSVACFDNNNEYTINDYLKQVSKQLYHKVNLLWV